MTSQPRKSQAFCLLLSLLAIILLSSACSRDPNVIKQKHFRRGEEYSQKGKLREAEIEYRNALKVDSNYADARHQLGLLYVRMQDWPHAYEELTRAVELQPEDFQSHIDLARLLIVAGDAQQATQEIDLLLKKWPNNSQSHFMSANLLAAKNDLPAAIAEVEKAISLDSTDANLYMNLGVMQIRIGETDAAEKNLNHAIELNPKEMRSRLLLAGLYQSHNRFPDAEQQLQSAIQADSQNPDPRAAMARLYLEEGRKAEAESFLQRAKQDFPNNSAGYRMLGDFYYLTGDVDNALTEYAALNKEHPKDVQVKKNYIELLILKNRDADARKLNDELLKADPNDNDALIYRGQLQLRAGDAKSAVATLQTVVKNDPNNAAAHYQLGAAHQQLGNLDGARSEWLDAMRLRPDQIQTVRALAGLSLRQGDMTTLEQTSNQMITLQPASPEGYALHAIVNINRNKFDEAEKDARKSIEVAPQSSFGYVQMGNLKFTQKQYKDAAQFFQQSLDRNAGSTDALRGLMNTYLAAKKPDQAVAAIQSQIAKSPNISEFYDLLGVAHARNKDIKNAEAAFGKALELDPNNFDAIINLGEIEASNGDIDRAIALYEQAVKSHSHEAPLEIFLGRLYESKHDWKKAEGAYQNALAIKPDDPLASNSLANVMVQDGGNFDVALSLAQTARHGLPDSPFVADTLGWIYYKKGAYTSSVSLLEEAIKLREKSKLPDSADLHYHLGLAYEKTDQRKLARQQLERVLQIDPNYGAAGDVKKQLAQLKS